jgi:hypothetical protein
VRIDFINKIKKAKGINTERIKMEGAESMPSIKDVIKKKCLSLNDEKCKKSEQEIDRGRLAYDG